MYSVIKMSKAWIAAFSMGLLLAGCGGSSSGSSGSASQGSDSQEVGSTAGDSTSGDSTSTAPETPDNSTTPDVTDVPDVADVPEVQPEKDRTAVLSWEAPATRINGEAISDDDLVQYEIRYGTDPSSLDQSVVVSNVQGLISVSYEIENLSDGTWYFSILAQDVNGLVSPPSDPVSKTI